MHPLFAVAGQFIDANAFQIISLIIILAFNAGINIALLRGKVDEVEFERYKNQFHKDMTALKDVLISNRHSDVLSQKDSTVRLIKEHADVCPLQTVIGSYYTEKNGKLLEKDFEILVRSLDDIKNNDIGELKKAINDLTRTLTFIQTNKTT